MEVDTGLSLGTSLACCYRASLHSPGCRVDQVGPELTELHLPLPQNAENEGMYHRIPALYLLMYVCMSLCTTCSVCI